MQAADARTTFRPRPFAGWALVSSCRLAAAFPSLLSHAVQCSPLKRQSLFACFAEIDWSRPDFDGRPSQPRGTG